MLIGFIATFLQKKKMTEPLIQIPSNFALIKEEVGGVAGYVGVLFFYRTIVVKEIGLPE